MKREYLILAVVVLVLAVPPGIAVAQTLDTHSATAGTTYQTNSGVTVTLGNDRPDVKDSPFDGNRTFTDKNLRITGSDGEVRITDGTYSGDPVDIEAVDAGSGSVTVTRTDLGRSFTVESGDANLIQVRELNATDGATDFAYQSDNGVTVTVTDVESAALAAVNAATGEPLASGDATGDGSATFDLPAGQYEIQIEPTPAELEVRNELQPSELVDGNVTLRARLFGQNDTVIQREVTDGTVSLAGVPLDEPLVVSVREENAEFTYRRILLDSAIETSQIYLLPSSAPSAEVRFQLRDDTGRFNPDETSLFVEKPITRDYDGDGTNETRYQTISGDRFDADGEFPTILVDSERYRLRVENTDGEQRVLGSYTVQGARVSPLPIGEVEFSADIDEGAAFQASLREAADGAAYDHEVRIVYADPDGETGEISVEIENSSGGQIRPETTEQINGTAAYVETYPITDLSWDPEQDTAIVRVSAQRGFATQQFEQPLGDVPEFDLGPLPRELVTLAGIVSILAVIGLLVIVSPALAALVGPGYAGLLTLLGIVPIPMPGVVLAGAVGVLAALGSRGG